MPVIMVGPNGAMIHKASIAAALAGLDAAKKTMIITSDQTVTTVTIPSTVALVVTNGAIITVTTALTVQGEFTKPAYNCFAGAGTVTLPTTGPGVTQSFSIKDLIMGGALSGVTTIAASGAATAASFNGAHNGKIGADLASATTTDIGAVVADYVNVTGTTTITGLGAGPVGAHRIVKFAGALTLIHSATLSLPGAANIVTVAGDTAEFTCTAASTWVCTDYNRTSYRPFNEFSKAAEGWVKLPGGIVVQWGSATSGVSHAFPLTPAAGGFTANPVVVCASQDNLTGNYVTLATGGVSTSAITAAGWNTAHAPAGVVYYYIAIGY